MYIKKYLLPIAIITILHPTVLRAEIAAGKYNALKSNVNTMLNKAYNQGLKPKEIVDTENMLQTLKVGIKGDARREDEIQSLQNDFDAYKASIPSVKATPAKPKRKPTPSIKPLPTSEPTKTEAWNKKLEEEKKLAQRQTNILDKLDGIKKLLDEYEYYEDKGKKTSASVSDKSNENRLKEAEKAYADLDKQENIEQDKTIKPEVYQHYNELGKRLRSMRGQSAELPSASKPRASLPSPIAPRTIKLKDEMSLDDLTAYLKAKNIKTSPIKFGTSGYLLLLPTTQKLDFVYIKTPSAKNYILLHKVIDQAINTLKKYQKSGDASLIQEWQKYAQDLANMITTFKNAPQYKNAQQSFDAFLHEHDGLQKLCTKIIQETDAQKRKAILDQVFAHVAQEQEVLHIAAQAAKNASKHLIEALEKTGSVQEYATMGTEIPSQDTQGMIEAMKEGAKELAHEQMQESIVQATEKVAEEYGNLVAEVLPNPVADSASVLEAIEQVAANVAYTARDLAGFVEELVTREGLGEEVMGE